MIYLEPFKITRRGEFEFRFFPGEEIAIEIWQSGQLIDTVDLSGYCQFCKTIKK